jgi:hypothetical protein
LSKQFKAFADVEQELAQAYFESGKWKLGVVQWNAPNWHVFIFADCLAYNVMLPTEYSTKEDALAAAYEFGQSLGGPARTLH